MLPLANQTWKDVSQTMYDWYDSVQSHAAHLLLLNAPAIFLIDDEGSQVVPDVDPVALYLNLPAT
jgi:hypothetical protein